MGTERTLTETGHAAFDDAWLEMLRARFMEIGARRVDASAVEDLVQDAMSVVLEKSGSSRPGLDWCFQVLRNVIGNHYRRERTRRRFLAPDADGRLAAAVPVAGRGLEALEREEAADLIREGILESGAPCREYLRGLVEGRTAAAIAAEDGLEPAVFYRRLYRCRQKLRTWLRDRGVAT